MTPENKMTTKDITMAIKIRAPRLSMLFTILIAALLAVAVLSCARTIYGWSIERWHISQADSVVVFCSNPFGGSGSYRLQGNEARQFLTILYKLTTWSSAQQTNTTPILIVYALSSDGHQIACIKAYPVGRTDKHYRMLAMKAYAGVKLGSSEESVFSLVNVRKNIYWERQYCE
jgi:hypothetical protein